MNSKLYTELLRDHYHNPRNRGSIEHPDFSVQAVNPACGDTITVQGRLENGSLVDYKQYGEGCMVSQAMASVLSDLVLGKSVHEILRLTPDDLGTVIGMTFGPNRQRCAVLALEALQKGLKEHA